MQSVIISTNSKMEKVEIRAVIKLQIGNSLKQARMERRERGGDYKERKRDGEKGDITIGKRA